MGQSQIGLEQTPTLKELPREFTTFANIASWASEHKITNVISRNVRVNTANRKRMVNVKDVLAFLLLKLASTIVTFTFLPLQLFLNLIEGKGTWNSSLSGAARISILPCMFTMQFTVARNTSAHKAEMGSSVLIEVLLSQWKPFSTRKTPLHSIFNMPSLQRLLFVTPLLIVGTVAWRTPMVQTARVALIAVKVLSIGWQHLLTYTTLPHSFWDSTWLGRCPSRCHTAISTSIGKTITMPTILIEKLRSHGKGSMACIAFLYPREDTSLYSRFKATINLLLLHQAAALYADVFDTITICTGFPEVIKRLHDETAKTLPLGRILGYDVHADELNFHSSANGCYQHRVGTTLLPSYYSINPPEKQVQGVII